MDYCKGGELVEWIPKKYKSFHERNIQEIIRKVINCFLINFYIDFLCSLISA